MCAELSLVSLKELVFWGWWSVSLWTPLCYFVATTHLFLKSFSIVLPCWGLLLNVIFSFSSSRCIRSIGSEFLVVVSLKSCRRVVQWASICFRQSSTYRATTAAHPLDFEVSRCRTSQFARCFSRAQTSVWNDLSYTVFDTGTLDGVKGVVNRWLHPWVCFSVFRAADATGVAKAIYKQFGFPYLIGPVLLVLIIIRIKIYVRNLLFMSVNVIYVRNRNLVSVGRHSCPWPSFMDVRTVIFVRNVV